MAIFGWKDPDFERELLSSISDALPWSVVERFSTLVRESGTAAERLAFDFLVQNLKNWGVPHILYEPVCLVSLPREARLLIRGDDTEEIRAKTPSFSVSTGQDWVEGELVYVPGGYAADITQIFAPGAGIPTEARGRVVLTEGYPMPGKVSDFSRAGVLAAIFISPGEYIHEGICTPIWGSPDLDNVHLKPTIPVLAVSRSDGSRLKQLAATGVRVAVKTRLQEDWRKIPVLVAEIPGRETPDEFVLVHGHLDSWHVGVGDNAVGDAVLLELARVFWHHRHRLARTLRVAWWSGHSHGRYAGSTWYADTLAIELMERCVAQVNCDSPGCRGATSYERVMWMSEAEEVARSAIEDLTGAPAGGMRPLRAGDYSFNNLGISAFYMLLSEIPRAERERLGLYAVGGCGGNIEWHTEDDTIEIADRENLVRDARVYAAALARVLNAPLHPFDYRRTVDEIAGHLQRYAELAGPRFDLSPAMAEARALREELDVFYTRAEGLVGRPPADPQVRRFNRRQRQLARNLVPVNYTTGDRFRHAPAVELPPIPDLAPAARLARVPENSAEFHLILTHLNRSRNRITWAFREARQLLSS
jgi:N-acetylated-alpha-linked acidic dipeptidase